MLKEFKEFVTRGNLVELAVAFIMGVAFASVIASFTNAILGAISYVAGGDVTFDGLGVHRGEAVVIPYGTFLTAVVNFLVAAAALFFVVKAYNRLKRKETPTTRPCPFCKTVIAKDATRCPSCTSQLESVVT
jgi:large conductance mechanosensitive channel